MQYGKLDAGLAGVLSDPPSNDDEAYVVSVRAARSLTLDEQREFRDLGGQGYDAPMPVFSAHLSREGIDKLSEKPWVRLLTLSRRSRPLA